MEELIKAIKDALDDETGDVEKYTKLAKHCWDMGHMEYAQIFNDIASEEMMHAKHLREILEEVER